MVLVWSVGNIMPLLCFLFSIFFSNHFSFSIMRKSDAVLYLYNMKEEKRVEKQQQMNINKIFGILYGEMGMERYFVCSLYFDLSIWINPLNNSIFLLVTQFAHGVKCSRKNWFSFLKIKTDGQHWIFILRE